MRKADIEWRMGRAGAKSIFAILGVVGVWHAASIEGLMFAEAGLPVERTFSGLYSESGNLGSGIGAAASVGGGWRHGLRPWSRQLVGTNKSLASSATDGQLTRETIEQQVTKRMDDPEFEKYAKDYRRFRYIEMKNGAKAFLVSDGKGWGATMKISFGRGWIAEPPGTSGFAHLMQTCALNMGTKRILDKEDAEGALSNGRTTPNTVSFMGFCNPPDLTRLFPIMAENLRKATYKDNIVIEQNVKIDEEFRANRRSWPIPQKTLSAFFDDHPAVRECLNSSALPIDETVAKLKDLHDRYVRSDKMAVILVGRDSLDELEAIAVKGLENYERSPDANAEDEAKVALSRVKNERWFTDEHLGKLVMYAPHWAKEGEHQTATFYFRVEEPTRGYWPMSLFTTLTLRDGVERIPGVSGLQYMFLPGPIEYAPPPRLRFDTKQSILAIPVRLASSYDDTTIQEVGDTIFSSLYWLRQQDAPVWWSDQEVSAAEAKRLSNEYFDSEDPAYYSDLPFQMLENMELKNVPLGELAMNLVPFDAAMWNSFLNNLRVDNMFVMVGGARWEPKCDKQSFRDKDKWGVTDLNSEWRTSWQAHEDGVKKVPSYDEFAMPLKDGFV